MRTTSAYVTAIPLRRRLPGASSNQPGQQDLGIDPEVRPHLRANEPRTVPIRSCSRWGLPCRRRYRRRGALLPHRFTLTAAYATPRGGLFSVALSLGSRLPDVSRHRLSMEPGLSSPAKPPPNPPLLAGEGRVGAGAAVRPTDGEAMRASAAAVKRRCATERQRVRNYGRVPPCSGPGRGWRANPARCCASTRR